MAKRPPLNDRSLLAAVFSPSKNPVPVGLRKRKLTGLKGRKATRLASYNSMSALNQKVLERSGQREAYLRGDITIAEAKRSLRTLAVDLGIAKPLKPKQSVTPSRRTSIGGSDRESALSHLYSTLTGSKTRKPVNLGALRLGTLRMTKDQLRRAVRMTAPQIKDAGKKGSDDETELEGKTYNPFWYH